MRLKRGRFPFVGGRCIMVSKRGSLPPKGRLDMYEPVTPIIRQLGWWQTGTKIDLNKT